MMKIESGSLVISKEGEQLMTVMRLVGEGDNDALEMMDNQLRANGFEDGAFICQWFDGSELSTATFNPHEVEAAPEKEKKEVPAEVEEEPAAEAEEDLFSDDDFDF